ncbi:MAG: MarC family protein [Treponema sp.]|jgi:multiple antibiotic resistance protein|nr:MarC family protein [Treponema sp.]
MFGEFLRILFTVFLVMDPIGMIPQFLSFTAHYDSKTRKDIILRAVLIAGMVLVVFLLVGKLLLEFFGISAGAFYISGGILFFLIAFGMIYSRPKISRNVPSGKIGPDEEAEEKTGVSVALFPLAIPLIAGPGLLTVIIMYVNHGESWLHSVAMLLPVLIINLVAVFVSLRCSELLIKFFGSMGIFIMEKIMGLILAGFAVQFIYDGLLALGIIHP